MTNEENKPENMGKCRRRCRWFIAPMVIAGIFICSAIVMWLWNSLMPTVFSGLKPIDYWQALGLFILAKLLFSSGFRGKRGCCCRHGYGRRYGHLKEKWMNMSEEEKAKFKEAWKQRCGHGEC